MSRKQKLSNVKERCRICLVEQGCMTNLFEEVLQSKLNDLSKCTSISIKDEHGLPNIICHICLYKLNMWNEFKEQFIRSNLMLLSQLELMEYSDNESKKIWKDSQQSGEDSLPDSAHKRKPNTNIPPLIPLQFANRDSITDQTMLNDMYISDDDVTSSKDSSQKAVDVSNDEKCKNEEEESKDNCQLKPSLVPVKVKPLTGRRNRTTERWKASTKRWVERKKALLAATGKSVSDSDSFGSDDTQLSPVQKARAKSNMDKEAEKQRRLSRVLKNLETNMTDKRAIKRRKEDFMSVDTDSETRRSRSFKDINSDASLTKNKGTPIKKSIQKRVVEKDNFSDDLKEKENSPASLPEKSVKEKSPVKDEVEIAEEIFTPCSVKSELEVGDATYIVTSTLMLAEPHYLNKTNLNTVSKECKNGGMETNPQEKNTDIIDAVQLRRINPVKADSSEKKCVERCLNIEVEGTEIEALKRVQLEVAAFVEKEMKHRLFASIDDGLRKDKTVNTCKNSCQTLDQQLKSIIEKTIKKNFESSMMRNCNSDFNSYTPETGRVSPAFVKEAMNSKKYQPKVVLNRLDLAKESKLRNINNMHVAIKRTVKNKLGGPFSMVSHKRQSVPPIRYNDYNTSALDSDSYLSEEIEISELSRTENHNAQKPQENKRQNNALKQVEESKGADSTLAKNEHKTGTSENIYKISSSHGEKHMCGVCDQSFNSHSDAIAHVRMHKTDTTSITRHNKHKMMRCKRCHEIVEARFVKAHVCKSAKQLIHKCYVCNSTFRTEKLLVRHLESHDQSEFNIENITKGDSQRLANLSVSQSSKGAMHVKFERGQLSKPENNLIVKSDNSRVVISNVHLGKSGITKVKSDIVSGVEKPKETYTCFVCNKIFTDEEILKDHLQKHCDDMSEGEQSQYQCAICGDSLDFEDALEAHLKKHLFDEEDDNPNLISIANENVQSKDESYRCLQCDEMFDSEMLLEMHKQGHEEEAEIAEWVKQVMKSHEYQCTICDDLFETEQDLSEHLDIHNGNAHVCQLCDKPFPSLEDLQKHVAATH